jgi:hypothetical protein
MTKAPISLQELRRRIYRKAKSDKTYRFWGIFVHITKPETLEETYRAATRNGGARALMAKRLRTSSEQGGLSFSPACGKN